MVLNEKGILRRFNLVVYPTDFVVAIGEVEEEVNKHFLPNSESANGIGQPTKGTAGSTYCIHDKKNNQICIMVWIHNLDECKGSIIAHECGHATLEIFNYIGATINPEEEQECFCYLLETLFRLCNGAFNEYKEYLENKKNNSKKK